MNEDPNAPIPVDVRIADIANFFPEAMGGPDYSPTVAAGSPAYDGAILIDFERDPQTKKFKFSITNEKGTFFKLNYANKHTLQIPRAVPGDPLRSFTIRVRLSDKLAWSFPWPVEATPDGPRELAPIRFTGETNGHPHWQYYKVHKGLNSDTSFVIEARQTGLADDRHPFNLYVLIEQFNGGTIPVIFDPDMDNPPK